MGANDLLAGLANQAQILERATAHPWVVAVGYSFTPGVYQLGINIVERRMSDAPDPLGYLPAGAELNRYEVFPAARFDDMPASSRYKWKPHYRAYLMWRKAKAIGKQPAELQSWAEYDPVQIDEDVQRWASPGMRFGGE
jgi:hypothetical protein